MYKPPYLLGIDSGTSACKVVLFTLEGDVVARASVEHRIYHPQTDWAEQDPEEWWRAAAQAIKSLLKRSGVKSEDILGLSVDSQREAVVALDKKGNTLCRSIIWLDRRAIPQQLEIEKQISKEKILEITGLPSDYIFSAPKILWMKENMPSVYKRVYKFLSAKDYIVYKLTGEMITDYSMASRTMLLDLRRGEWSEEICEVIGISIDLLPEIKGSWEVVGEVTREASELTGLSVGTIVAAGGGDRPCEALGSGAIEEGLVNIGTGTGSVFEVPLSKPKPDRGYRFDCCYHVVPGMYEYEGIINATGASLKWFLELFGGEEVRKARELGVSPYAIVEREALKIEPGSEGLMYYPHLWGARLPKPNPKARGVFIGILHSHTRGHFLRAILEGVAYQYLGVLKVLEELGIKVNEVSMVGGEVRSDLWNRIKANVMGIRIKIPKVIEAASLGSAILAGLACRAYSSVRKAVERVVKIHKVYEPDLKLHRKYLMLYEKYKKAYELLEELFYGVY